MYSYYIYESARCLSRTENIIDILYTKPAIENQMFKYNHG